MSALHKFLLQNNLGGRGYLAGGLAALEDAGGGSAFEFYGSLADAEHGSFAQSDDGDGVLFEILEETLFAGFAHMFGIGIRVLVVRIDLVRENVESIERGR